MQSQLPDKTKAQSALHRPTTVFLVLLMVSLWQANFREAPDLLSGLQSNGWPLTYVSRFYHMKTFDWGAALTDVVVALLILASTAWLLETWAENRYRLRIVSLLGTTAVVALLASFSMCGIIPWSSTEAPWAGSEFARCYLAVSQRLFGQALTFEMYSTYSRHSWERIPYSILFLGLGLTVYAFGRALLLLLTKLLAIRSRRLSLQRSHDE